MGGALAGRSHFKKSHKTGFNERQTQATMLLLLAKIYYSFILKELIFQYGRSVTKYLCLTENERMFPDKKLEV